MATTKSDDTSSSTSKLDPDDPKVVHVSAVVTVDDKEVRKQWLQHEDGRRVELGDAPKGGGDGSEYAVEAPADLDEVVKAAVEKALAERG